MATTTKAAVIHHKTWLIPLVLVIIGVGVGIYFFEVKDTFKEVVQVKNFVLKSSPETMKVQIPQPMPVDKIVQPKFTVAQYNSTIQVLLGYITPTISLLSVFGGFFLLIMNIIKAIKSTKPQ
jgi:hypothetical protein